jgi:SAM-dependent methyltransferase/uncharacterized protein YbaR (Trm112 family)
MDLALTEPLCCPTCAGHLDPHPFELDDSGGCETGLLACSGCGTWYPITGSVLDLLPEGRAETAVRCHLLGEYGRRIEALGLRPPARGGPADPDFVAQAHQREHFDDLAVRDDEFSYGSLGRQPFQIALRELTYRRWLPKIPSGSVVLDIGCADGISTFDILGQGVRALGFDVSRQSLVRAAARAREEQVAEASFFVGDADAIPVVDAAIDCVLCFGSLHHVPDPARTLAEVARVLRPGGLYLGVENNVTPLRPIFDLLMRLRPLWREEAGPEAQLGRTELDRWTAELGLELSTRTTVFVPPHLCNRLGVARARTLLSLTDAVFARMPGLREWGGLIVIEGRKP